ncbi:hypothetical protein CDAR_368121 [Caerostris darwini]|uniref:Uncharacterized protein n=1 Tax=Caerostris darwini TaxID=1538125 RepID=A0AAV4UHZ0_9ARAC|nr:hypothetical protein CDAR_368121 [Caerostris darwini]
MFVSLHRIRSAEKASRLIRWQLSCRAPLPKRAPGAVSGEPSLLPLGWGVEWCHFTATNTPREAHFSRQRVWLAHSSASFFVCFFYRSYQWVF